MPSDWCVMRERERVPLQIRRVEETLNLSRLKHPLVGEVRREGCKNYHTHLEEELANCRKPPDGAVVRHNDESVREGYIRNGGKEVKLFTGALKAFQCKNRLVMAQRKHLDDFLRGRIIRRLECGRTQLEVSEELEIECYLQALATFPR
ncbi:transposable element Tcb1 transposase [Trichonephila clavipes]|nr:transposable element Tcb1 transposase [Trichonephila clavipes]